MWDANAIESIRKPGIARGDNLFAPGDRSARAVAAAIVDEDIPTDGDPAEPAQDEGDTGQFVPDFSETAGHWAYKLGKTMMR